MFYFEVFEDDGIMPAGRIGWVECETMPTKEQALDLMMRLSRKDLVKEMKNSVVSNVANAPKDCVLFVWRGNHTRVSMLQWPADLYRNVSKHGNVVKLEDDSNLQ